jgi:hypothetical protein
VGVGGAGKELNEIPRLRRCLGPGLGRSGDQKLLEFSLALSQGGLVEPDLLEPPRISVSFWAFMPRCSSSSTGSFVMAACLPLFDAWRC